MKFKYFGTPSSSVDQHTDKKAPSGVKTPMFSHGLNNPGKDSSFLLQGILSYLFLYLLTMSHQVKWAFPGNLQESISWRLSSILFIQISAPCLGRGEELGQPIISPVGKLAFVWDKLMYVWIIDTFSWDIWKHRWGFHAWHETHM